MVIDKENLNFYHQLQMNQMQKKLHYVTNVLIIFFENDYKTANKNQFV